MRLKYERKCFKVCFHTRQEAKNRMKEINRKGVTKKPLNDVYFCEECKMYHLTSLTKESSRELTQKLKNKAA